MGNDKGVFTPAFFDELINVAKNCRISKIHFTGGEPLLEKKLPDFIKRIKRKSCLDIGVTTNGILLGSYSKKLYEAGLDRINISIPTLDPKKYKLICGQEALKQVLQNIDDLAVFSYNPIKINIPVFKGNVDEIGDFLTYFLGKKDILIRFFSVLPNQGLKFQDCLCDREITEILEENIRSLTKDLKNEAIRRVFYRPLKKPSLKICTTCSKQVICRDQAKAIRITKDGKFSLCLLNPKYSFEMTKLSEMQKGVKKLLAYYYAGVKNDGSSDTRDNRRSGLLHS